MRQLTNWYEKNKRDLPWRHTRDIYAVWVSETMLQQTQVETVIPYYLRFLSAYPDVKTLAGSTEQEVLKMWQGLGYYSRARNLFRAAQIIEREYHGAIPDHPGRFSSLPGVGPYITAAVLSITRNLPLPAVDGNVLRVFARYKALDMDIRQNATRRFICEELSEIIPCQDPGTFNQSIMELGATICTPRNPLCGRCPLAGTCQALYQQKTGHYPVKSPKPAIPEFRVSVAVILRYNRFFIQKRPSKGHLGGLWEFPGGKANSGETDEQALLRECREELGVRLNIREKLSTIKHAYTHFKIELSFFACELPEGGTIKTGNPHQWITVQDIGDYPFPSANHKFFPILKSYLNSEKN